MHKTIYNYDPHTGEWVCSTLADESPLEPGVLLIPPFATDLQPPEVAAHEVAVFDQGQWHIKADWRTVPLFSTQDGSTLSITQIGITPADVDATAEPIPSSAHAWRNGTWVLDAVLQASVLAHAQTLARTTIDQCYAETLQQWAGNPSQAEKETWALKLETANAIVNKTSVSAAGLAFLESAGKTSALAQSSWARAVLTKSAAYARAVGLAEKLRDTARSAVKAASDEAQIKMALTAQRVAAAGAVATARLPERDAERVPAAAISTSDVLQHPAQQNASQGSSARRKSDARKDVGEQRYPTNQASTRTLGCLQLPYLGSTMNPIRNSP